MHWKVLLVAAVAVAAPVERRDDVVTMTSTTQLGWAQLLGLAGTTPATVAAVATTSAAVVLPTTTAPAPVIPVAAATTSQGLLDKIIGFFDSGDTTTAVSAAATTPAAATTVAAPTTTPSNGSWLSNVFKKLFGSGSTTTTATTATVAATTPVAVTTTSASLSGLLLGTSSSSSDTPGFTGLVSVEAPAAGGTSSVPSTSAQVALNLQIAKIATYAEMGAGITYSPYTKSGQCKSASEIQLDISMLSAYGLIRLYSVDCSGIQNVISALSSSQKVYLGVWSIDNLDTDLLSLATQVLSGSRGWKAVHTVAIGNELVNAGTKTPAQIQTAVTAARAWFKANASGYSGYIVSVDTLAAVMANPLMCDISDYLAVNCHPYFSGIEALTLGTWLQAQVAALKSHCNNGKDVLITESGWPTYGNTLGSAVPSTANQLLSIKGLGSTMGSQVIMFTTYNDYWKAPGPYNVEQNWGIYGDPDN